MRINNKPFKDFYDGMCYGVGDNSIFYDRTPTFHSLPNSELNQYHKLVNDHYDTLTWKNQIRYSSYINTALLGFCGKVYPLYYANRVRRLSVNLLELWQEDIDTYNKKYSIKPFKLNPRHFSTVEPIEHLQHFIDVKAPIFIYCDYKKDPGLFTTHCYSKQPPVFQDSLTSGLVNITTVTNISLQKLDFHRFLDIYQTYQELEMFLGNVLTKPEVMPVLSNVGKRDSHGFDNKSFKQVSPGKKFKRRQH